VAGVLAHVPHLAEGLVAPSNLAHHPQLSVLAWAVALDQLAVPEEISAELEFIQIKASVAVLSHMVPPHAQSQALP